jgi:hypothetical protein
VYSCTADMSASLLSILVVGVWVGFSKMLWLSDLIMRKKALWLRGFCIV